MESVLARVASLSSTHLGAGRNKLFIRGIADRASPGRPRRRWASIWATCG
ncbi:hypothetical protein ACFSTI_17795 [Rhizorhabdus histidinilytica]